MVQILPRAPSLGELLGSGVGQGFAGGLQMMAPMVSKDKISRRGEKIEEKRLPSSVKELCLCHAPQIKR